MFHSKLFLILIARNCTGYHLRWVHFAASLRASHWFGEEETALWLWKALQLKATLMFWSQISKLNLFAFLMSCRVSYGDHCQNWRGQELQPQRTTLSRVGVSVLLCPQVKTSLNKQCFLMPNGVHSPCTADVNPPRTTSSPTLLTYLLFGSLHPSFMLKLTLGAEAGRQGVSSPHASRDVAQLSAV